MYMNGRTKRYLSTDVLQIRAPDSKDKSRTHRQEVKLMTHKPSLGTGKFGISIEILCSSEQKAQPESL